MLERFTWFKQSAYRWDGDGVTLYIDPWGITDDSPPADVVLITHAHGDHFQLDEIEKIRTPDTIFVAPRDVAGQLTGDVRPVAPGDTVDVRGIKGQTVPAYNVVEGRRDNHPKANGWVGYLLELDGSTFYHAGDTDHLPELEQVPAAIAFLPIGGAGYTMDAREAAGLARAIAPQIAVPMHYGFFEGTAAPAEAETFREAAAPVRVEILEPREPFAF